MLIAHAQGARRRWRQPLLRGPAWFFDVKVQPGFYSGAGKKILDRYRMRMLMPLAILALCLSAVIGAGYFGWLTWICLGTAILIHVNHAFSVDKAEK
jgi:hypothetical protein